ncbi:MAG TPA: hypothetical protein VK957_01085 [Lunatimonas sp.]|nr:hypothetical protein [Lunatimonas sp.]
MLWNTDGKNVVQVAFPEKIHNRMSFLRIQKIFIYMQENQLFEPHANNNPLFSNGRNERLITGGIYTEHPCRQGTQE